MIAAVVRSKAKRRFAGSLAGSLASPVAGPLAGALALTLYLCIGVPASALGGARLADDSLLVQLRQHGNRSLAQSSLLNEAQANTLNDIHSQVRDYSILVVKGPTGEREATLAKIQAMMKTYPEILSVSRNYVRYPLLGSHGGGAAPNDPDFAQQWPLAEMRWTAARALYGTRQVRPATITIVGGGSTPVYTNNELGPYIKQYNALSSTAVPFPEPVSGTGTEGDVDSSITGALTGNGVDICGAGCFISSNPCRITMLNITGVSGGAADAQIANALMFRINNQHHLGGPGPVNLSYGSGTPNKLLVANSIAPNSDPPLWGAAYIQEAGLDLLSEGSIFVLAAGDNRNDGTIAAPNNYQPQVFDPTSNNPYPDPAPGNVVVVQASANDSTNAALLTQVVNDPTFAPGDMQPAIIDAQVNSSVFGSSFAAPLWCSAVAMLMSMNPALTAAQSNQIIVNTGTVCSGVKDSVNNPPPAPQNPAPTWRFVIPAFDRAIQAAIQGGP